MTLQAADLPDDPDVLKALLFEQQQEISHLKEQLHLLIHKRFGSSSEKHTPGQLGLFNEAEQDQPDEAVIAEIEAAEAEIQIPAHPRKKPGRKPLPDYLPRVRVVHDLPESEKVCSCCGNTQLHQIGEEVSEQLEIIPAVAQVIQHVRPKYGCRGCDGGIKTAPLPPQPIPKSIASPGLLAHIATCKYQDGLPLYRLETTLQRSGIELPRATMAHWMIRIGELVQPLINLLRDKLLDAPVIHCDETTVQVLKEPGKTAQSKSYMWVQVAGGNNNQRVTLFDYNPSRSGSVPERLLAGYRGYLQTDGYEGYAAIGRQDGVINQGCWAHARRKFDEAIKAQGNPQKGKPPKAGKAQMGLSYIQKLYRIEKQLTDQPPNKKLEIRQQKSLKVLADLRKWLEKSLPQVPPKSALGKALHYLHNQWDKLVRYCDAGYLRMDNNLAENAIRPFVVGRKNWLFSNSQAGARSSANLYSLLETAKANGVEPYTYLSRVLTELPAAESVKAIENLLPWSIQHS